MARHGMVGRVRSQSGGSWAFHPWAVMLALGLSLGLTTSASAGTLAERVFETTLGNGLKVLLVEEPKAPVVTVQVWYKVGSRNEQVGKTGLSHMLEHMMFKGTPKYGPKQFDLLVTRNGGVDNAETQADFTGFYEDFAADRVGLGLELEADRMANLLIDLREFEPEHQVVIEERRLRIDDQSSNVQSEVMRATAFFAHAYRNPTSGWPSDMEAYTREDVVKHYRTYYAPNNATLVVAGDVKRDALLPKIQALFGSIPRQPDPPKVITEEPPQIGERRVSVRKEAELPLLFVVYHVPNLTHPDCFALQALAYILGGGESARFHQKVVYEKSSSRPTRGRTTTPCTWTRSSSASVPGHYPGRLPRRWNKRLTPRWSECSASRSPIASSRKPRTRSSPSSSSRRIRSTSWPRCSADTNPSRTGSCWTDFWQAWAR